MTTVQALQVSGFKQKSDVVVVVVLVWVACRVLM